MSQKNDFKIDFISDINAEELMVEVSFKEQRFFQLSQENGIDDIEIEFLTDLYKLSKDVDMRFKLRAFETILHSAVSALKESK